MRSDLDGSNIEQLLPVDEPANNHHKRHSKWNYQSHRRVREHSQSDGRIRDLNQSQNKERRYTSNIQCDCESTLQISSHITLDHTNSVLGSLGASSSRDITWFYFFDTSSSDGSGVGRVLWAMDINGCHCRAVYHDQQLTGN